MKLIWATLLTLLALHVGAQDRIASKLYTDKSEDGRTTISLKITKSNGTESTVTGTYSNAEGTWIVSGTYTDKKGIKATGKLSHSPNYLSPSPMVHIDGEYHAKSNSFEILVREYSGALRAGFVGTLIEPAPPKSDPKPGPPKTNPKSPPKSNPAPKQPPKPVASANTWGLVEVIADPDHLSNRKDNPGYGYESTELMIGLFKQDIVGRWPQNGPLAQDFHFSIRLEAPPASIREGDTFDLTVLATCMGSVHTDFRTAWGYYRGDIEGKLIKAGKSSPDGPYTGQPVFVGNDPPKPFEPTASGVYRFHASGLPKEFSIIQVGNGLKLAIYKYRKGAAPIQGG